MAMVNEWQRPETSPYPRVYRRFKGKKPMPDGRVADFWVQDATVDMDEEIADHMMTYFSRDEPMSRSLNYYEEMSDEMRQMGKAHMKSLVHKRLSIPDKKIKKFQRVMFLTLEMVDVYKKYGVDKFTTALGLSVKPEFRGQNLGVEILKGRAQMTSAIGLQLTLNNFTGFASQKQAERAGYELLVELPYSEVKDEEGNEMFPGIEAKTLQFRAKYVNPNEDNFD
ncbi:Putative acetyltransferase [Gryllus bimaculatus]|nr:Putative acetyltransferase [Gryllus bimaculatus]